MSFSMAICSEHLGFNGVGSPLAVISFKRLMEASSGVVLATVGIVLAGVVLVWLVRRWTRTLRDQRPVSTDLMTQFRQLREQGELSEEEFQRIRRRLAEQLRRDFSNRSTSP